MDTLEENTNRATFINFPEKDDLDIDSLAINVCKDNIQYNHPWVVGDITFIGYNLTPEEENISYEIEYKDNTDHIYTSVVSVPTKIYIEYLQEKSRAEVIDKVLSYYDDFHKSIDFISNSVITQQSLPSLHRDLFIYKKLIKLFEDKFNSKLLAVDIHTRFFIKAGETNKIREQLKKSLNFLLKDLTIKF